MNWGLALTGLGMIAGPAWFIAYKHPDAYRRFLPVLRNTAVFLLGTAIGFRVGAKTVLASLSNLGPELAKGAPQGLQHAIEQLEPIATVEFYVLPMLTLLWLYLEALACLEWVGIVHNPQDKQ